MSPYQVVIHKSVLTTLIAWFYAVKPKEGYALLGGVISHRFVYKVDCAYMPTEQLTSKDNFTFTDKAKMEAASWVAKQKCELLGIAHSHIYPELNNYGVCQSVDDAILQQENHLTLSAVIAFFGDSAAIEFWLNGFSAPLTARMRVGKRILDIPHTLRLS